MKRGTGLPARRRKAIRHAARTLVLLLVVQNMLHVGLLLPIQAIRMAEEREGVRGTRILRRLWEPDIGRSSLFYLTANETALVLSDTYLTLLGWQPMFGHALDCTGGESLYVTERRVSRLGVKGTRCFFYGRVDSPAIEMVELSLWYIDGHGHGQEHTRLAVPREAWLEQDGRRYFLLQYDMEDWPEAVGVDTRAIGRDSSGAVVTEFSLSVGVSATYG